MKFSIVVAAYNAEKYIDECISSLLMQDFEDYEVIFVDDGSDDRTLELVKKHLKANNLKIYSQKNKGVGPARMEGMLRSIGEYILFFDADDVLEDRLFLKKCEKYLSVSPDIIVFGAYNFRDQRSPFNKKLTNLPKFIEKGTYLGRELSPFLFQICYGWAWDKVFKREFLLKKQISFPSLRHSEDLVFVFSALLSNPVIVIDKSIEIAHRMKYEGSVSGEYRELNPFDHFYAIEMLQKKILQVKDKQIYQKSFNNWLITFLFWHCWSMRDRNIRAQLIKTTKNFLDQKMKAKDITSGLEFVPKMKLWLLKSPRIMNLFSPLIGCLKNKIG